MKYLGLFLSDENIRYEIKNAKGIEPINEEENDRIMNRYSKAFKDIRFNIVLFNLKYPKKECILSEDINNLMEDHYDVSLIVEIYADGKLYTINDYLHYSYVDENSAKEKYEELYNIINNDNVDDTINSVKALKKA